MIVIIVADSLLLFCAGVFNPVFTTYRMNATTDDHMARVGTAWSISAKTFQPAFIAAGGLLAAATSIRLAIAAAAITLLASSLLLPWRQTVRGTPTTDAGGTTPPLHPHSLIQNSEICQSGGSSDPEPPGTRDSSAKSMATDHNWHRGSHDAYSDGDRRGA